MASVLVPLLPLLGPLALVTVALSPARGPAVMARRAEIAALAGLVAVLASFAHWALSGPHTPAVGAVLVYVDALSAIMLVLVSFVGAVVVRYSRNYLDGDPGQERFFR
jgi:NAD(P)H-quinone oxidoreductase subunit 5